MKKRLMNAFVVIIIISCCTISVHADAGPKPSIRIEISNLPGDVCYVDLLVESDYEFMENLDKSEYDEKMFSLLQNYRDGNWKPAISAGARELLFGDIVVEVVDNKGVARYSYIGVPDKFKIIVVTEDLNVVVSNEIERKNFESIVEFDYETGIAKEKAMASFIFVFLRGLAITLLMELIVLIAFRFNLKKNLSVFLIINSVTQIILHTAIYLSMAAGGIVLALLAFIFMEFLIFIGEMISFAYLLKGHTKLRRVLFAFTANVISFVVGLIFSVLMASGI